MGERVPEHGMSRYYDPDVFKNGIPYFLLAPPIGVVIPTEKPDLMRGKRLLEYNVLLTTKSDSGSQEPDKLLKSEFDCIKTETVRSLCPYFCGIASLQLSGRAGQSS